MWLKATFLFWLLFFFLYFSVPSALSDNSLVKEARRLAIKDNQTVMFQSGTLTGVGGGGGGGGGWGGGLETAWSAN